MLKNNCASTFQYPQLSRHQPVSFAAEICSHLAITVFLNPHYHWYYYLILLLFDCFRLHIEKVKMILGTINSSSVIFRVALLINMLSAASPRNLWQPCGRRWCRAAPPDAVHVVKSVNSRSPLHRCARLSLESSLCTQIPFLSLPLFDSTPISSSSLPLSPPPPPSPTHPPASHHWACRTQLPLAGIANTKKSCSCEPRTSRQTSAHAHTSVAPCKTEAAFRQGARWEQAVAKAEGEKASRSQQPDSR